MRKILLVASLLMVTVGLLSAEESIPSDSTTIKTSRIINGVESKQGAWPSTVALLDVEKADQQNNFYAQFCGGSLVASKWVLTAAHCVVDSDTGVVVDPSTLYALVGATNLLNDGQKITVNRIIVYPGYNHNTDDNDLALLELEYQSSQYVPSIAVSVNDAPTNLLTTVVGWGELKDGSNSFPEILQQVEVPIVNRATCEETYGDDFTQNMICAGYSNGGKDTCKSDSGGPMMGIQHGEYVQVGITSWGVGCAQVGLYGVYTRLSNFEGWIKSYTGRLSYPSGGENSWSRFYTPESGGSTYGLMPFLLFMLGFVSLRRLTREEGQ